MDCTALHKSSHKNSDSNEHQDTRPPISLFEKKEKKVLSVEERESLM